MMFDKPRIDNARKDVAALQDAMRRKLDKNKNRNTVYMPRRRGK